MIEEQSGNANVREEVCSLDYSSWVSDSGDPGDPGTPSVWVFFQKKWQLKDGKHPEESAEVFLPSGQDKSGVVLEAFGWGVPGQIMTTLEGLHCPDMLEAPPWKWPGV